MLVLSIRREIFVTLTAKPINVTIISERTYAYDEFKKKKKTVLNVKLAIRGL